MHASRKNRARCSFALRGLVLSSCGLQLQHRSWPRPPQFRPNVSCSFSTHLRSCDCFDCCRLLNSDLRTWQRVFLCWGRIQEHASITQHGVVFDLMVATDLETMEVP